MFNITSLVYSDAPASRQHPLSQWYYSIFNINYCFISLREQPASQSIAALCKRSASAASPASFSIATLIIFFSAGSNRKVSWYNPFFVTLTLPCSSFFIIVACERWLGSSATNEKVPLGSCWPCPRLRNPCTTPFTCASGLNVKYLLLSNTPVPLNWVCWLDLLFFFIILVEFARRNFQILWPFTREYPPLVSTQIFFIISRIRELENF